jgi:hypothetical protein
MHRFTFAQYTVVVHLKQEYLLLNYSADAMFSLLTFQFMF